MGGSILVVDDEAASREGLKGLLSAHGFNVWAAHDGHSALESFPHFQPDLVLLDVMMPELSGFDVCRRLKNNPDTRLTPVVLITGLSETQDRIRGLEAGADDFLSKPINLSELLARVRSLLSLKDFTDELERAESVLFALSCSIEAKDPYPEGHCRRYQIIQPIWARALDWMSSKSSPCGGRELFTTLARWLCPITYFSRQVR